MLGNVKAKWGISSGMLSDALLIYPYDRVIVYRSEMQQDTPVFPGRRDVHGTPVPYRPEKISLFYPGQLAFGAKRNKDFLFRPYRLVKFALKAVASLINRKI